MLSDVRQLSSTHDFSERRDDFSKRRQWLVDVGTFLESSALRSSRVCSLTACQVHQTHLAYLLYIQIQTRHLATSNNTDLQCMNHLQETERNWKVNI